MPASIAATGTARQGLLLFALVSLPVVLRPEVAEAPAVAAVHCLLFDGRGV